MCSYHDMFFGLASFPCGTRCQGFAMSDLVRQRENDRGACRCITRLRDKAGASAPHRRLFALRMAVLPRRRTSRFELSSASTWGVVESSSYPIICVSLNVGVFVIDRFYDGKFGQFFVRRRQEKRTVGTLCTLPVHQEQVESYPRTDYSLRIDAHCRRILEPFGGTDRTGMMERDRTVAR